MGKGFAIIDNQEVGQSSCASSNPAIMNVPDVGPNLRLFKGRVAVVTLGCAKNRVDSEVMLGSFVKSGFEVVVAPSEADVILVNTCSFLESSVKESVDAILEVSEFKSKGRCRQILVAGCLVERYREELKTTLPEVDQFVSIDDISKVGDIASGGFESVIERAGRPYFLYDDTLPRYLSTKTHTAYVKISEGCNRPCTFCIIPKIRGLMRSREMASVLREIQDLGSRGVKEINLIAQDLTNYGVDNKTGKLSELLVEIDKLNAVPWIRLLYAYPVGTDDTLLKAISELPSVVEYLDIPLQHSSEPLLKAMQRPLGKFSPRKIVEKIKTVSPNVHIRTTFIVGFPGETEADVSDLEAFILEGHFTNLGVFKYSPEPGTPAFEMPNQISEKEKEKRHKRLMLAQQKVNTARLKSFVGQQLQVLIEGTHEDTDLLFSARTRFQAPEIDGTVIINEFSEGVINVTPGQFGRVEITEVVGYDLVGKLISIDQ
ncbi:MAG: 30S ribosomal protein S12 methylthiotransferase RimO [bacterium]|nr:30S ribosomal protein S12 methylthiotransferase RimO [bacterium]